MGKKNVSLVLSSGGAREMTHIEVIQALEEKGYEIGSIAGCSAETLEFQRAVELIQVGKEKMLKAIKEFKHGSK